MTQEEEIIQILRSPEAAQINFSFESYYDGLRDIEVNSSTFLRVASAIEAGRIRVTPRVTMRNAGGHYSHAPTNEPNRSGVLHTPRINNRRYFRMQIIHEAVHASLDLTRSTIAYIDNEMAAFIAGAMYMRLKHYPLSIMRPRARQIYSAASLIAGVYLRGEEPTGEQLEHLERRIRHEPLYRAVWLIDSNQCGGPRRCYAVNQYDG